MSSGGTAGLVTGAGVTFTAGALTAGGAAGFAGAAAGLAVGGVVATATATATTVVGAGDVEDSVSTVMPVGGVAAVGGSGIVVGAETPVAGSTLFGVGGLGSFAATGALGGPAHAETHSAKNAIVSSDAGIHNTLVQGISSPINGKQSQAAIIDGNLCARV